MRSQRAQVLNGTLATEMFLKETQEISFQILQIKAQDCCRWLGLTSLNILGVKLIK